ncbi:SphA family protein [Rhizobium oryziradicis]|uniref:SphA family protein n=1 Tax=Rhizobium oryziradicis TaxID=1867956 RepID=UPI0009FAB3E2|nr:transporter [Rhizobium oryziradicis]
MGNILTSGFKVVAPLALALCCHAGQAGAAEGGTTFTPFGVFDFGAGLLPPPSPVGNFGIRTAYYTASHLRDGNGNKLGTDFKINVESVSLTYLRMTEEKILGGNFGFGVVVPVLNMKGKIGVVTGAGPTLLKGDDFNLGDVQFLPILLGWTVDDSLSVNGGFAVQAPTGAYDASKPFNVGNNVWTFTPYGGVTYMTKSGFEVSSNFQLNFNTENPDTKYKSGVEYKHEFAVGQHFGPWTAGVGGYYHQQISDDKGAGVVNGNRGRAFALGPALSYFEPGKPLVSLHAYKEFGVRNRAEGYNIAVNVAMSF